MKVSADYRMLALDALRGKWKAAVLTGIAASAFGATIVSGTSSVTSNSNQSNDINFEMFSQPNGGRLLAVLLASIGLWAIFTLIVGGAVRLGYARFNLNLADGKGRDLLRFVLSERPSVGWFLHEVPAGPVHRPLVAAVGDSGNRKNIQLCDDTLHHGRASFTDGK